MPPTFQVETQKTQSETYYIRDIHIYNSQHILKYTHTHTQEDKYYRLNKLCNINVQKFQGVLCYSVLKSFLFFVRHEYLF